MTKLDDYYTWLADLKEKNRARTEYVHGSLLSRLVPDARPAVPTGPVRVTAAVIVRCYRVALGEIDAAPPLDPDLPAAAIVRAYRKALGEIVDPPDEPTGLAASRIKITAVEPVAKSHEETDHEERS
jgi:hypothetical protein